MPFDRITAAFSAASSHIMMQHSSARTPSSDSLGSGTQSHRFGGSAGPGQKNFLRLSSSLQDFSTYKFDPEQGGGPSHELDRGYARSKPNRDLLRESPPSFSKEKVSPPASPLPRRKWFRMVMFVLCLLLLFSMIFVCFMYFSGYWSQRTSNYYVILDCGSTGTRVYVYEWSVNRKKGNGGLPINLRSLPEDMKRKSSARSGRAYQRMETEPGFDKLVRNESGLRTAMTPLLRWAKKQIPKHAHKSTSIFLYATAGVRRLPSSDSKWLLDKARSILKDSSFMCQKDWVKIISGMEEAYYGWIALNYHMNVLGSVPVKETFGSLDLGGSSLQVTFETEKEMHDETSLKLSLGSVNHHLSAYSLSGYGLNDAFDKSVVHLIRKLPGYSIDELKSGRLVLKHPCLQTGYKEQYLCSQCGALTQEGSPLIGGRPIGKGQTGIPVQLLGAPQWEECSSLAKTTVNLSEWSDSSSGIDCDIRPCALTDNLPRPRGHFYAMSGFFVVFKFFNLTSEATPDDLLLKGQEFCEKTWEIAKNSVVPQPFIEQYCFRAPYVASLLRDGLHIRDSEVVIGSGSITWTLGVALLEAGQTLSSRMDLSGYRMLPGKLKPGVIVILLIAPVLLFCAISFASKWLRRYLRRSYIPLFRHNSGNSGSVLNFQRWSPISSSDGRVKMPLSPTVAGSGQHPFGLGNGFGGSSIQLMESSSYPSTVSVSHSFSSGSLGQMHSDNGMGSFWVPNRQMRLWSRRSSSREDLSNSLGEAQIVKT